MRRKVLPGSGSSWWARAIDLLILAVAAWASPLQVWANNPVGVNYPVRLLLVGLVPWVLAVGALLMAERLGVRRGTALLTAFMLVVAVMRGGSMMSALGSAQALFVMASSVGISSYLVSRRDDQNWVLIVLVVFSLFLAAGPAEALVRSTASVGADVTRPRPTDLNVDLVTTPHIFLIVTDGYAGRITLGRDFGLGDSDWAGTLTDKGFEIPRSAWTSYSVTEAALPSLLDMSYPIAAGQGVRSATKQTLYEINGGDNRLVTALKRSGYRFVMIESGWSGSSCGPTVDECVASAFIDEATFIALSRTVLGEPLLRSKGFAFGIGAQHSMNWLVEHVRRISASSTPHLVYAHLMIPHPPFFLDPSCDHTYQREMSGVFFQGGPMSVTERKEAYLEQASCVDRFISQLVDQVSEDSVVVLISDHGSDIRDQLRRHPDTWNESDLVERMNILLAVKGSSGCSIGDRVVIPNVMRRLLSCLSDEKIADIPTKMFKISAVQNEGEPLPIIEVDPSVVRSIATLSHE